MPQEKKEKLNLPSLPLKRQNRRTIIVEEIRLAKLISAQWDGNSGLNYTLYGLDTEGKVYRKDGPRSNWKPVDMRIEVSNLNEEEDESYYGKGDD